MSRTLIGSVSLVKSNPLDGSVTLIQLRGWVSGPTWIVTVGHADDRSDTWVNDVSPIGGIGPLGHQDGHWARITWAVHGVGVDVVVGCGWIPTWAGTVTEVDQGWSYRSTGTSRNLGQSAWRLADPSSAAFMHSKRAAFQAAIE